MNRLAHYEHSPELEEEDVGHDAPIFTIDIYDENYLISLGHERKLPAKKNTYYFPVYLLDKQDLFVHKQIGVYEFLSDDRDQKTRIKAFLDKDGDIDPTKLGDLLLYNFADKNFFESSTDSVQASDIYVIEDKFKANEAPKLVSETDEEQEDDPFKLEISSPNLSKASVASAALLKNGVFENDSAIKVPPTLIEESKDDSLAAKKDFKHSKKNEWIENFMKNNNYSIVDTAINGDCFFDAIRQAFLQQGLRTSIEKLRALVAMDIDETIFNTYMERFREFETVREDLVKEMDSLKKEVAGLKKRMAAVGKKRAAEGKSETESEQTAIETRIKEIAERNEELKEMYSNNSEFYNYFSFMKTADSIENLREYVKTSKYWADEWAIGVIERRLGIKCIIFAEDYYKQGDVNWILKTMSPKKDRVLQCTTGEITNPQHYVILNYNENHYKLISYKNKYLFQFSEIPYDVKIMVVIKCMEGPSVYNRIQAFRSFQSKLGLSVRPLDEEEKEEPPDVLEKIAYDSEVVFMFYNKSANTVAPGKASGEDISPSKSAEYKELGLKKYQGWRRMLDDYWPAEFTIDGHRWQTVEHYYQASKFRKTHPEFYMSFSLDKGSEEMAKDVEVARIAGSQSGAKGKTRLRPENIKVDSDFYGGRNIEEREKAIYAKFTQNADLKKVLLLTKDAKLVRYIPKKEAETDIVLMRVRKKIREENVA